MCVFVFVCACIKSHNKCIINPPHATIYTEYQRMAARLTPSLVMPDWLRNVSYDVSIH